jgi:hypothetical protein
LARVIRDDAIEVDGYATAEPFFATNLQDPVKAVKVHWKPSMLKIPLFRKAIWTADGWQRSETEAMHY